MKKFCCKTRSMRRGFTLLEVLFTVVILVVLTSVAIPLYTNTKVSSQHDTCLSNIRAIAGAESKYHFDNAAYAGTVALLSTAGDGIAANILCPTGGTYVCTVTGTAPNDQVVITCNNAVHAADGTLKITLP